LSRPDQLLLEDDPSFLPTLTLESIDLHLPDFAAPLIRNSQLSTSLSLRSLDDSRHGTAEPGLMLPSDTTGDIGGFTLPATGGRLSSRGPQLSSILLPAEEEGLLPEADFAIDAEGNLVDFAPAQIQETVTTLGRRTIPHIANGEERAALAGTETERPTTDLLVGSALPSF